MIHDSDDCRPLHFKRTLQQSVDMCQLCTVHIELFCSLELVHCFDVERTRESSYALRGPSGCLFLPCQKHKYKWDGHDGRSNQDGLECTRVNVEPGQLHKGYWKDSEEPERYDYRKQMEIALYQCAKAQSIYLFPVAANALCSRA